MQHCIRHFPLPKVCQFLSCLPKTDHGGVPVEVQGMPFAISSRSSLIYKPILDKQRRSMIQKR
jgi:hypothetical protein